MDLQENNELLCNEDDRFIFDVCQKPNWEYLSFYMSLNPGCFDNAKGESKCNYCKKSFSSVMFLQTHIINAPCQEIKIIHSLLGSEDL